MEEKLGLYDPKDEHDACGVGFVANIKGQKSHSIIVKGLEILKNLTHRGAVGADPLQGDGAGILIQIPHELFKEELLTSGITLPPPGEYGVGMIFLPQEAASCHACCEEIERAILAEGQKIICWRDVPVDFNLEISEAVKKTTPIIKMIFIGSSPDLLVTDAFERKLFLIRKRASIAIYNLNLKHCQEFYIPSLSSRTIVYKGQLLASQVGEFYLDLKDSRSTSALAVIHQRFSTNTFPKWSLAHPFRMLAHNGEINTLRGNFNWICARQKQISSPFFGNELEKIFPLIFQGQSDSASLDNAFELLVQAGYPLAQAMMMLIPEAWEKDECMDKKLKAYYEYHAALMEPWDGPAAVIFTDGRQIGAALDRNGLRPARYLITKQDELILASEAGTLEIDDNEVLDKLRLEPGKMLLVDLEQGRIINNNEIKTTLSTLRPYEEWVSRLRISLDKLPKVKSSQESLLPLKVALKIFGYSREELESILKPMAQNGSEPLMSMGNDVQVAALSKKPRLLYDYFRQMFAQVTNPPIDPIRENLVTSLISFIGPRPNLLDILAASPAVRLEVNQPILTSSNMEKIRHIEDLTFHKFKARELDITYPLKWGKDGIEARLASLKAAAIDAIKAGINILIITDKKVSYDKVAIPALLATSAIHQCLVQNGLRTSTGLVVETGSARTTHHFALLAAFGAEAIYPYSALEIIKSFAQNEKDAQTYEHNYLKAIDKGLYKIMAKMGISTYMSYTGAQIFEALGLNQEFVTKYFTNTPSKIEGIGLFEIADEAVRMHQEALKSLSYLNDSLISGGALNFRPDGQEHMWTTEAIYHLQHAVRENSQEHYDKYAQIINDQGSRLMTLRGMLRFKSNQKPIALSEVESVEKIVKRFSTAAMSLGSISTEAHCTLALAMNHLGGMSNSGEGGEDPLRFKTIDKDCTLQDLLKENAVLPIPLHQGDSLKSKIKQVASGRFGVTASYLDSAEVIQIKMAQGAKPGEGGQLPGDKVTPYIAYLRHCLPGISLVSPPPHHDIYSIEDLAQLIYDLKSVNPRALISVKLVAQNGVGTVAAGVAKCKADHIVISGHDGGTGAAPISSVKNTGGLWEIGLSEVQQTLSLNNLRSRVRVQVDGQIKTGRDVVIGAILGADEFGFGTAPLVALGCMMMRKCQKNTCPAGIATQDPQLRKNFVGKAQDVINYFNFVAQEVREIMASLGIAKFDDLIGHTELLEKENLEDFSKAQSLSFEKILFKAVSKDTAHFNTPQQHEIKQSLDFKLKDEVLEQLLSHKPLSLDLKVKNTDRALGTYLSGQIVHHNLKLEDDFLTLNLKGTAGQSLGAFLTSGITLNLTGEANDYVGKGLCGGLIVIKQDPKFKGKPSENIIAGNTCLYGATEGKAFISGKVGERFAVRNSGATAICEGAGDHLCEYMTGGTVIVLGEIGRNFAAGMSGGIAYIFDPKKEILRHLTPSHEDFLISYLQEQDVEDLKVLENLIKEHHKRTASAKALEILENFKEVSSCFVKVIAKGYQKSLQQLKARGI